MNRIREPLAEFEQTHSIAGRQPTCRPLGVHVADKHDSTAAVVAILAALGRGGHPSTAQVAERSGVQRDTARRILRELVAQGYTQEVLGEDLERWKLGMAAWDLLASYRGTMAERRQALLDELALLELPLTQELPAPPSGAPRSRVTLRPERLSGQHHRGTAMVCAIVGLLEDGEWWSGPRVAEALGSHPVTVGQVLVELGAARWVERAGFGTVELWRLGPGLGRIAAQYAGRRGA